MYVILDTNVVIPDYYFKSPKFKALFNYLSKTPHKLVIPRIVLEELKKNHAEDIAEVNNSINKINYESKSLVSLDLELSAIDLAVEIKNYSDFLDNFIEDNEIIVPDYDSKHYEIIISKSLSRKAPFKKGANDYGFKDAVLWQSVKDLVSNDNYEFLGFITKNTNQFSDATKIKLHSDLAQEIEEYVSKFYFFTSLEEFLEKYGQKLESISEEELQSILNKKVAEMEKEGAFSEDYLKNIYEGRFSSAVQAINFEGADIKYFYVSKATKDYYYVETVGLAKAWVVYWNPLDDDVYGDMEATGFDATFKISNKTKEISVEKFSLDKVEPADFYS